MDERTIGVDLLRCEHPSHAVVRRENSNGVMVAVRQCVQCGANLGCVKLSSLTAPLASLPWWDEARRQAWSGRYEERRRAEREDWWARYDQHLQSDKWFSLRRRVLARCGGTCEGCAQRQAVQVHHLHYRRLGDEMLFDLVALCLVCHQKLHPSREIDPLRAMIEEARGTQDADGWTPFDEDEMP